MPEKVTLGAMDTILSAGSDRSLAYASPTGPLRDDDDPPHQPP